MSRIILPVVSLDSGGFRGKEHVFIRKILVV